MKVLDELREVVRLGVAEIHRGTKTIDQQRMFYESTIDHRFNIGLVVRMESRELAHDDIHDIESLDVEIS